MLLSIALSWWLGAAPSQAAGTGTSIVLSLSPNPIPADGSSTTTATATVTDPNGGVQGDTVSFATDGGQAIIGPASGTTDSNGNVTAIFRSTTTPGPSTISATDSGSPLIVLPATKILNQTPPPPPPVPVIGTHPTISGTAQQGSTLAAVGDTWQNNPTSFNYAWERCLGKSCSVVQSGPSSAYVLTALDVQHTIRVVEIASNAGGPSAPVTAGPTSAVIPLAPVPAAPPPTITGSPAPGQTLTEAHGGWNNNPTSFSYQWETCSGGTCVPSLFGANQPTYVVNALDLGHTIQVVETATNLGGSGSATSAQTGIVVQFSSTTSLSSTASSTVTNRSVNLTATVTAILQPAGHVTFYNGSAQVAGCANVPVVGSGGAVTATCQTSFAASTSPEALTAAFTADTGSSVAGSQSGTVRLAVGKDSTSTALDVSNLTVKTGSSTTYTATVSPGHAGPFRPTGLVEFLDGGKPIGSCLRQGLGGSPTASAKCTIRYKKKGTHRITAVYGGDLNFNGALVSPVLKVSVRKLRTGTVTSTMQWTFFFTPAYTRVLTLVVNGPPLYGTVLVECHGNGCPFAKHVTPVATFKSCIAKGGKLRCSVHKAKTLNLMGGFRKHHLRAGAKITVELLRPNFVGKNYVFKVRSGSAPQIQIRCVAPGAKRPGVGC